MRLGSLRLDNPLILAPMLGLTNYSFRKIARDNGCGLAFTEMVSADGLLRKGGALLNIRKDDHPLSVQLFGSSPDLLARAANMVEMMGADAIDINMGCPSKHVTGVGAGVDLMRFPEKIQKVLMSVRREVKGPLTIKIRSGWDKERINAVEISKIAEDCGVDAISIHPRTKVQGFRGQADWNLIGRVKARVRIPVIGNGDVTTPSLAKKMAEETGCDGIMIGRGALGNPWIFHPEERTSILPSLQERREAMERHLLLLENDYGEQRALKEMQRQVAWYMKGLPFSVSLRSTLSGMKQREMFFDAITSYFDLLAGEPVTGPSSFPSDWVKRLNVGFQKRFRTIEGLPGQ